KQERAQQTSIIANAGGIRYGNRGPSAFRPWPLCRAGVLSRLVAGIVRATENSVEFAADNFPPQPVAVPVLVQPVFDEQFRAGLALFVEVVLGGRDEVPVRVRFDHLAEGRIGGLRP